MSRKTVSVIIATYNGEKYLRKQLDSILKQTFPIHEIIIQDDCSSDSTSAIAEEYAMKQPNVQFYRNESNMGYNKNFETAAMRATGDFVAISDQDDIWFPEKIEKLVKAIGEHDLCFSDHIRGVDIEYSYKVEYKASFLSAMFTPVVGHSMLLRRDFAQDESNWGYSNFYDWSLLINAHAKRGVAKVSEVLGWHRLHEQSVTTANHTNIHQKSLFSPIIPYIKGYKRFRTLQTTKEYKEFYEHVYEITTPKKFSLEHEVCVLLISSGIMSFLKLCMLCMRHREELYPTDNTQGLRGRIRSFFFPSIFAYHTDLFDNKKYK